MLCGSFLWVHLLARARRGATREYGEHAPRATTRDLSYVAYAPIELVRVSVSVGGTGGWFCGGDGSDEEEDWLIIYG